MKEVAARARGCMLLPNLSRLAPAPTDGNGADADAEAAFSSLSAVSTSQIATLLGRPSTLEFTVENPGIDDRARSLWNQPYVVEWLTLWKEVVQVVPTTYCQYAQYPEKKQPLKPTSIMTTFQTLQLQRPCTPSRPCPELCDPQSGGRHSVQIRPRDGSQASLSQCERNAIPERLTHQILATWIGSKWKSGFRNFLLVDVFAGWGSVKNAVATFANSPEANSMVEELSALGADDSTDLALRRVLAISNPLSLLHYAGFDAVDQRVAFREPTLAEKRQSAAQNRKRTRVSVNVDTKYIGDYMKTPNPILNIIAAELAELTDLDVDRVAIWIHASPPCTTFSMAGLATHRPADGPVSALADEHDRLVKKLLAELALLAQLGARSTLQ